jgi:Cu-Zn family superoxide dismutase
MTEKCQNIGGHYNPYDLFHGDQKDNIRHVGDLGNIEVYEGINTGLLYIEDS